MLKQFLLLTLVFSGFLQECGEGCLKCGNDDLCQVCNFLTGYQNISGKCEQKIDTKCITQGVDGICLHCNINYHFDANLKRCVAVTNKIENCLHYSQANNCIVCQPGFYPSEGICVAIASPIKNCLYYQQADRCAECQPWYTLSSDFKQCSQDTKIENCSWQTNFYCNECKPGYILNQNHYVYAIFNQTSSSALISNFMQTQNMNTENNNYPSPCQQIKVQNCQKIVNAFECEDCENQYYLTEQKICKRHPLAEVIKCLKYTTGNQCELCDEGYFKSTNNTDCLKHTNTVDNCKTYSQVQNGHCSECTEDFYLSGNVCIERVNSKTITGCVTKSLTNDICTKCEENNRLTSDNLKCLAIITDCKTYALSDKNNDSFKCTFCTNNKFINTENNTCESGTITNCLEYSDSSTCETCENGYYLTNNTCAKQPELDQCKTYSNTVSKSCTLCNDGFYSFNLNNACIKVNNAMTGCHRYTNETTCEECSEGFQLNGTACDAIPASENCLLKNGDDCTKCKLDHFLHSDGNCYPHFHYQLENCKTPVDYQNSMTGHLEKYNCYQCKAQFFWRDLGNEYVCLAVQKISDTDKKDGCLRYRNNGTRFICEECHQDKFLTKEDPPTCVDSCTSNSADVFLTSLTFNNSNDQITNIQNNVCEDANKDKVYKIDQSSDASRLEIGNCGDKLAVYQDELTSYNFAEKKFTFGYSYQTYVKCEVADSASSTQNHYPNKNDTQYKCQSYKKSGDKYYCITCQKGYTGKITKAGGISYNECNVLIEGCSNDTYGGFYLDQKAKTAHAFQPSNFYSCHKCANNFIPFIFMKMSDIKTTVPLDPQPFNLQNSKPVDATTGTGLQVQCLEPKASSFEMLETQFTLTFPSNCGLGLFNIFQTKDYTDIATKSIQCVECQSGYKKITDSNKVVTACQKIPNCDENRTQHWFNSCQQCSDEYAWAYDGTTGTDYSTCIKNTISNCLIVQDNGATQICKYCVKGFDLIDNKCERYIVPKCNQNSYLTQLTSIERPARDGINYDNFWMIAYFQQLIGCSTCPNNASQDYVSVYGFIGQHQACITSFRIQNYPTVKHSGIIPYCLFFAGNTNSCIQCNEGYVLKQNGIECVVNTLYRNCDHINTLNKCDKCLAGYYLILDQCVRGTINHCEMYENQSEQLCKQCQSSYRPSINQKQCILGNMNGCSIYEQQSETSCKQCINDGNTFLYQSSANQKLCFPLLKDLNCEQLNSPGTNNMIHTIQCNKCKPGFYTSVDETNFNRTHCIPHYKIEKCLKYVVNQNNFYTTSYKCTECEENHYVSEFGYSCKVRTVAIQNCKTMNPLNQKCQACVDNYYLSQTHEECIQYPTGVKNCIDYFDDRTCTACDRGFYLSANVCVEIPTAELIENCQYYNKDKQCNKCNSNFYLHENKCLIPAAKNCVSFNSPQQCASCNDTYYLVKETDSDVINCVYKELDNCLKLVPTDGNCQVCKTGYYVQNGICDLAIFINHCQVYDSRNTCVQCEDQYFLSQDRKSCLIQGAGLLHDMDNCKYLVYKEMKQCFICEKGFYFKDGKCITCNGGEGCAVCDYRNPDVCLMCNEGFYQKKLYGLCTATTKNLIPAINPSSNNKYVQLLSYSWILFSLML